MIIRTTMKALAVIKPVYKTIQIYKLFERQHNKLITYCPVWIRKFF